MPLRRRELELSVERPLSPGDTPEAGSVRLTARFEVGGDGPLSPGSEELQAALDQLREALDRLRLPSAPARPDRSLEELIETYRPRQPELVDLLREEGQLTPGEHATLKAGLFGASGTAPPSPAPRPTEGGAGATAPRPVPSGGRPRTVPELLETYRIESLRQAGIVRARREISFDEYMALKRHFQGSAAAGTG
ncbi:MAG: hypothetical protein QXG65_02865 [Thermoplasmata archaeon]